MAVYQINKGIGRSPEFKGLRSQYLFIFAGGLLAILIAFMMLYMAGVNQLLSVRIEPSIQRIIDRYSSALSPYVFPILISTNTKEAYEEYQVAINNHNRLLRRLSKMLPVGCKLTSYTSRHSWATAARNHNVPISVISAGMGHTSEQTTQIYLTMLENSVIDDANQGLIRSLLE